MILKRFPLGNLQTNCYILADEVTGDCAVIDPSAEAEYIMSAVRAGGFTVKYIILTHVHIDHIMALDEIKAETGAPVVAHIEEAPHLNDDAFTLAELFGTDSPRSKADITVADGETLRLGDGEMRFIHTPGHTVGGMCILCDNMLIAGDTLFAESVGRTDFHGGSHAQLISSIRDKLMTLDDSIEVYPGHGPSTTIGHEREANPYF